MEGGNRLTAGQGRNKDEHMRILNASATNLADAINYTRDQQTPEATHVELLNNNIGSDTWGSKLGEQIPWEAWKVFSLPLRSRPKKLKIDSVDTFSNCCFSIKAEDALSS